MRLGPYVMQEALSNWAVRVFGLSVARNIDERCLRFLEEAVELVQSLELSREAAHRLVDYVYDREPGNPMQEVGGVCVTLFVLADSCAIRVWDELQKEFDRIHTPEIITKIRNRQEEKRRALQTAD